MSSSPIAATFGEELIGVILSAVLYGVTLVQTLIYFTRSASDSWALKAVVITTFVLDTVSMAMLIEGIWFYLIESFTTPENLYTVHWSTVGYLFIAPLIAMVVQLFYAWRIQRLSQGWLLFAIIGITAVAPIGFDFSFAAFMAQATSVLDVSGEFWKLTIGLAIKAGCDVIIAASMTFYLFTNKSGISRTDSVVNKLILYAVSTGLVTTVFSVSIAILFQVSTSFAAEAIYFCVPKLYVNSMLSSLNMREAMRDEIYAHTETSIRLPHIRSTLDIRAGSEATLAANQTVVHIGRSRVVKSDEETGEYAAETMCIL